MIDLAKAKKPFVVALCLFGAVWFAAGCSGEKPPPVAPEGMSIEDTANAAAAPAGAKKKAN